MKKGMLCLALLLASAGGARADQDGFPTGVLAAPGGRYVFGQISQLARHQYMLDTLTGRLWLVVCARHSEEAAKDCTLTALQPIDYLRGDGSTASTPDGVAASRK